MWLFLVLTDFSPPAMENNQKYAYDFELLKPFQEYIDIELARAPKTDDEIYAL